ncbi:MAG: NADH-quinone oxidoreductase subunit NuoG, partial [Gammaproteobacteria bacterium]|nr:NADH-quinone oxidoreductase subunit NuoG [Gammaproteobacteria bacterium]
MVSIEIDGKQIKANDGAMVIEAADDAGISIPRFCYHKKLSVAANCRMCLVHVEKARKPLPACATPVTEGMKIFTRTPLALQAQKGVMEFLLINHPLDCPICDQGGECELQDVAMGYGSGLSRYCEGKRVVEDKNLGPLIATEMTRCIHCTRCVRFGEEIAGIKELGATGRGEHMKIGTYVEKTVDSELSGNVIDLCPVGALTSKPFRYRARAWEMRQADSIAPHDCVGSNIHIHTKGREVLRVVPRDNEAVNETWISDRDRFSYEGIHSADRVEKPRIKESGRWTEVSWEHALAFVGDKLKALPADKLGFVAGPSCTSEEYYLFQKLARALGTDNIDYRLRQLDISDQAQVAISQTLGQTIEEFEQNNAFLLVGSNLRKDQPILGHRLRKAGLRGASVSLINSMDHEFRFPVANKLLGGAGDLIRNLAGVTKELLAQNASYKRSKDLSDVLSGIEANDTHRSIAKALSSANKATVILGNQANYHPQSSTIRALAAAICELSGAKLSIVTDGGNSVGAQLMGVLPHRGPGGKKLSKTGLSFNEMLTTSIKGLVVMGAELDADTLTGSSALETAKHAEIVVSITPFSSAAIEKYAHVMLPVGTFAETSGTYINTEGRWQSFEGAVQPYAESRPAWKVLRVLGNVMKLDGFDYFSTEEVMDEIKEHVGHVELNNLFEWEAPAVTGLNGSNGLEMIGDVPIYSVDAIVRRAAALQGTTDAVSSCVYLNSNAASKQGLMDSDTVSVV